MLVTIKNKFRAKAKVLKTINKIKAVAKTSLTIYSIK